MQSRGDELWRATGNMTDFTHEKADSLNAFQDVFV